MNTYNLPGDIVLDVPTPATNDLYRKDPPTNGSKSESKSKLTMKPLNGKIQIALLVILHVVSFGLFLSQALSVGVGITFVGSIIILTIGFLLYLAITVYLFRKKYYSSGDKYIDSLVHIRLEKNIYSSVAVTVSYFLRGTVLVAFAIVDPPNGTALFQNIMFLNVGIELGQTAMVLSSLRSALITSKKKDK